MINIIDFFLSYEKATPYTKAIYDEAHWFVYRLVCGTDSNAVVMRAFHGAIYFNKKYSELYK